MKPRIIYDGKIKYWKCYGNGITTFHESPNKAYILWRMANDEKLYMERKTKVYEGIREDFSKFYPFT